MIWLTLLLMAILVFGSRYVFLAPKLPLKLNAEAQKLLSYSSVSVLTAIWAPIVFVHQDKLDVSVWNPYLIAAACAMLMAWKSGHVLVTTVISMSVFFLLQGLATG